MKTGILARICIVLLLPLTATAEPDVQEPLSLAHALEIAAAQNPALAKSGAKAQALAEIPGQVGMLPDPVLSLNALNFPTDTFSQSQEAMTQTQLGLGVTLPFPGKLGLREQAASLEASSAAAGTDEMRLALRRDVSTAWWNLFYLDRALDIVQRNLELMREFVHIAEAKYSTGQGMQSDVLLAQVELSRLLETEIGLKAARRGQAALMNSLLGLPAPNKVLLPRQAEETLPAAPGFAPLHDIALQARPALSAQRTELEAARTRVALAQKDYYPDFKLGAAYGFRGGYNTNGSRRADVASLTFSMNLPLFTAAKQDHAVSQRKAEVLEQEYGLQDRIAQMDSEIEQALADYRASREQTLLLKTGIIPQARQAAAATLAAYRVDKADFPGLIRAQLTLYNYETRYWKALGTSWQAWARLEAGVGQPLANTTKEMAHEHE